MIKQLASAVLWAMVALATPADDADVWTDDGLDDHHHQGAAEIRSVSIVGLPLAEGEDRPAAWVAKKSDRPLAVATVGDGQQAFVAEMQLAFVSVADPEIGLELIGKGLTQARERGALKVLIDPGVMHHEPIIRLAETRGFHYYRSREAKGITQLEFLVDLYWRGSRTET